MALTKKEKEKILEDLKEKTKQQKAIFLVGITGLKVKDSFDLRRKLKKDEAKFQVAKKTLIEKAFKENDLVFDKDKYKEEIALVFGFKDEIIPAKTAYQFSKENENLKILEGYIEGRLISREEVIAMAQLPSKEELLAKLVGSFNAPINNFVRALNYNIKGLLYVLSKVKT